MIKRNIDFILPTKGLDDLFSTQEMRDEEKLEKVQMIPLNELHPFKDHPFKIENNEEMERMVESIRRVGAITPALARPLPDGGYELISGHRRLMACQQLGIEEMPVIVREMSDDEAVITMVDANLQREKIQPSEKAFAYKMKMGAMSHQGKTTLSQVATKSDTAAVIGEQAGESRDQVFRYIRLTNLLPEILEYVDDGRMALTPAVELSYLTEQEQNCLLETMESEDCTPSLSQAQQMKRLSQAGKLNLDRIFALLTEQKPNQVEKLKIPTDRIRKYFPKDYNTSQIEDTIVKLCEAYHKKRMRDRDAR